MELIILIGLGITIGPYIAVLALLLGLLILFSPILIPLLIIDGIGVLCGKPSFLFSEEAKQAESTSK